jgi:hypothetical protein
MMEDDQQKMEEAYKEGIKLANDLVKQFNFLEDPTSFTDEPPPEIHPDILYGYMEGIKLIQDIMFNTSPFLCPEMTMAEQELSEQYEKLEQLKNNNTNLSSSIPKDPLPKEATIEQPIITCEPNLTNAIQNAAISAGIGAVKNISGGITGSATAAGTAIIASVLDDLDQVRDCKKQYDQQTSTVDRAINKTINKAISAAVTGVDPISMLQQATKKAAVHITSSSVSTLTATMLEKQDDNVDCRLNKSLILSNMVGGAAGVAISSSLLSAVTANPVAVSTATLFGAIGGTVQGYVEAKKEQNSCIIKKEEEKNATNKSTTSPRP